MNKKSMVIGFIVILALIGIAFASWPNKGEVNQSPEMVRNALSETPTDQESALEETPTPLANGSYSVVSEESSVTWEGRKILIKEYKDTGIIAMKEGTFTISDTSMAGRIVFDMESIKAKSTGKQTGETMLEGHLKSDAFFDVEQFPTAELVIKEVTPALSTTAQNQYTVRGDLTIKGITNEVSFLSMITTTDSALAANGTVEIDRTKWDVRYGSNKFFDNLADNVIDDNFTVTFELVAEKSN